MTLCRSGFFFKNRCIQRARDPLQISSRHRNRDACHNNEPGFLDVFSLLTSPIGWLRKYHCRVRDVAYLPWTTYRYCTKSRHTTWKSKRAQSIGDDLPSYLDCVLPGCYLKREKWFSLWRAGDVDARLLPDGVLLLRQSTTVWLNRYRRRCWVPAGE